MDFISHKITMPDGTLIELETGKLARQADGAIVLKVGQTMLLATVCSKKDISPDIDFFPLTVEYQEKFAATGKFPGGFLRREGRPSEYEILNCRIVDRALRPMFPEGYNADTQIMITLISGDINILPDAYIGLAASAAIMVSDIPFDGPISEVRVAQIDGQFIINPNQELLKTATLDLIVAGSKDSIVMVEGEMLEVSEETMVEAIKVAHEVIKMHCDEQLAFANKVSKAFPKRAFEPKPIDQELYDEIHNKTYEAMYAVAKSGIADKNKRKEAFSTIKEELVATYSEEELAEKGKTIKTYLNDVEYYAVRAAILKDKIRLDGRSLDQVRPIWCEVDYLPGPHGSALFTRGETQSLTTVTLGTKMDEQLLDGAIIEGTSSLLLHYNFPGFSTGEVRPVRGTGRREIGHGNLALRALKPMIPSGSENPYTIRIVSDILESNGSSSMATVCAGTLALLDAGIQLKSPVSGIAMGLITGENGEFSVLSDILGDEDHLGDMDFKVTGTEKGVTACQMDIKIKGLSYDILLQALQQAKHGRLHILGKITDCMSAPRPELKPHAPRMVQLEVDRDMIGAIIGPGGKIIQEIQRESGATITITEVEKGGVVDIFAVKKESLDEAMRRVKAIIAIPEMGATYMGKIKNITAFGAFVEFMPGKDGLLHISDIKWERVEKVEDELTVGDAIEVKLTEVDKKTGKYKVSRKALLPKPEGMPKTERPQATLAPQEPQEGFKKS